MLESGYPLELFPQRRASLVFLTHGGSIGELSPMITASTLE
jgi:hypothetical protein